MIGLIKKRENIKNLARRFIRGERFLRPQLTMPKSWFGNSYGGFFINPDLINSESIVYSVGIGEDISFDLGLMEKYNCKVFAFDPTPKSIEWVKKQDIPDNFIFTPCGLNDADGEFEFHLPKNETHVSGSVVVNRQIRFDYIKVPMKRLNTIMKELGHSHIDLLKMDIEGAEYSVIKDILDSGINIRQIVMEFHHRVMKNGLIHTKVAIQHLNKMGYKIFAISDFGIEVSFINTKGISK